MLPLCAVHENGVIRWVQNDAEQLHDMTHVRCHEWLLVAVDGAVKKPYAVLLREARVLAVVRHVHEADHRAQPELAQKTKVTALGVA